MAKMNVANNFDKYSLDQLNKLEESLGADDIQLKGILKEVLITIGSLKEAFAHNEIRRHKKQLT
jgi:hypothetical protein